MTEDGDSQNEVLKIGCRRGNRLMNVYRVLPKFGGRLI